MNKLLLLLSFTGLVSCQPKDQPVDAAARASGKYTVQSYVVFGDTLYTINGINKIGVSDFYIVVGRRGPDSAQVSSVYMKNGSPGRIVFIKEVGVSETNGTFQLSFGTNTTSGLKYESRIDGNVFRERTEGGGLLIPPVSGSLISTNDPALKDIIISAKK